ncbi:hypothetical protein NDU88_003581 [Pleurodeles waltl]|uniref:Secreted protein n=1 Tax=Pleurodeles waltl TaxID=8319 RepID=A0AAV7VFS1_PLEWA|nr:hypothetical protein NDU88_003579 [Pleurodeles waltl]KAJ1199748.1 hypothetical protein NDU88_003581 [Pleurodeles waltl]
MTACGNALIYFLALIVLLRSCSCKLHVRCNRLYQARAAARVFMETARVRTAARVFVEAARALQQQPV